MNDKQLRSFDKLFKKFGFYIVSELCILLFLLLFVFGFRFIETWIYDHWPTQIGNVAFYSLPKLTGEFLIIACIASVFSIIIGISLGLFCYTQIGSSFKIIIEKFSMIIQSIPTMAVLMFGMMAFGIGRNAAIVALLFQSLLPVVFSTFTGLDQVSPVYIEVAKAQGMTNSQIMYKVKIPLSLPVIFTGIRTSVIICISAATLAFSTGAGGLGLLIQTGCSTYNTVYIMEGTIPICLIAILCDLLLRMMEQCYYVMEP